ncbi:MAG: ParA family protein [Candidatus Accumulibacter sp.]|jgi:chromosome partitioning protein|nr:ParA family protein [Accumulibacter sp.]
MKSFLIANPKGGSGKSTLAVNLAAYFASRGHAVMLGDADRQQSSRDWLELRSPLLPKIHAAVIGKDARIRAPEGTTRVVLDTPAGLRGKALENILKRVDRVVVPVQPSTFDILATRGFIETLMQERAVRKEKVFIAVIGMRVDSRTRAAAELERFLESCGLPVLAYLRDAQLYVQTVANGMAIFDLSLSRAEKDLEQWAPLLAWVES